MGCVVRLHGRGLVVGRGLQRLGLGWVEAIIRKTSFNFADVHESKK